MMITGGNDCISRATGLVYYKCLIFASNPISRNGTLVSWCSHCRETTPDAQIAIRIYRDDGTNYVYVGGGSLTSCPTGLSTHTENISVLAGDLVGIYVTDGSIDLDYTGGTFIGYKTNAVDITTTTPKSDWTENRAWKVSIGISLEEYHVKVAGGNDSNNGLSWANAWATVDKAAKTVPDGSIVHIGFGTYNAEPANNDIAPVNAGTVGIKYLPETATTGGGTGSVIVEVN